MKKLFLILMAAVTLSSCSTNDDDGPTISYELAEITGNDLPDEFERGETYTVTLAYVLPSECSTFAGIDARREGNTNEKRRNIYVAAVSSFVDNGECNAETNGASGTSTFSFLIDDTEDFTFYFFTGFDDTDQAIYDEVTVPVVEPEL